MKRPGTLESIGFNATLAPHFNKISRHALQKGETNRRTNINLAETFNDKLCGGGITSMGILRIADIVTRVGGLKMGES